jgi:hypothetical protein
MSERKRPTNATLAAAIQRADKMEQYDYCYCASKEDFEAIKTMVAALRELGYA